MLYLIFLEYKPNRIKITKQIAFSMKIIDERKLRAFFTVSDRLSI